MEDPGRDGHTRRIGIRVVLTVEKPDTWIISNEPDDNVAVWVNEDSVSSHGCLYECGIIWIVIALCNTVSMAWFGTHTGNIKVIVGERALLTFIIRSICELEVMAV